MMRRHDAPPLPKESSFFKLHIKHELPVCSLQTSLLKTEIIKSFISEKFSILLERCNFSAFIHYFMGSFVSTAAFIIII